MQINLYYSEDFYAFKNSILHSEVGSGGDKKENGTSVYFRKSPVRIVKIGSALKITTNSSYNFTKFHPPIKRKKFKEMTSQSQARTSAKCGLPRTAPFTSCHNFGVAVSLCQFHRQSLSIYSHPPPYKDFIFYQNFS